MAEEKASPRVIRRGTSASAEVEAQQAISAMSDTFSATLSNGRTVTLREMTAGDLLYLEKALGNLGDMERSLKLAVRLSTGDGKISYEDLQKLKMKDLRSVTTLLTKAGDVESDDEDEFPND